MKVSALDADYQPQLARFIGKALRPVVRAWFRYELRGVERLPTVVTINIDPFEWPDKLGGRLADRLGNRLVATVVRSSADSYRRPATMKSPGVE